MMVMVVKIAWLHAKIDFSEELKLLNNVDFLGFFFWIYLNMTFTV